MRPKNWDQWLNCELYRENRREDAKHTRHLKRKHAEKHAHMPRNRHVLPKLRNVR